MKILLEKGVAPVVAEILMISITVVLVAVILIIVLSYTSNVSKPLLVGTFLPNTISTSQYNLTLTITNPESANVTLVVFAINGSAITSPTIGRDTAWWNITGKYTIQWHDENGNGLVDSNDIFTVTALGNSGSLNGITIAMSIPAKAAGIISITLS